MKKLLTLLLPLLFIGCTTYDSYGYRDDGYYEDRYYGGGRYVGSDIAYPSSRSYYPDYVLWSDYYSVLWPLYRNYYDPFYSPGFYYGVTWYPRTYFGLNHYWNSWPYYHAYAPYRYSYWDGYYDRWQGNRGRVAYQGGNQPYRFGSARNEAQALARRTGAGYGVSSQPGVQYNPYAAQSSTPLSRAQLRTTSGFNGRGRTMDGNDTRGVRGERSNQIRRAEPERMRNDRGSISSPRGERPVPRQEVRNSGERSSDWVSGSRRDLNSAPTTATRSAPYYRDINGTAVPVSRVAPVRQELPVQRAERYPYAQQRTEMTPRETRYQRTEDFNPARESIRREQYDSARTQAPARSSYAQPAQRYEPARAAERNYQPSRSSEAPRQSYERSSNVSRESAREQVRRDRDEE